MKNVVATYFNSRIYIVFCFVQHNMFPRYNTSIMLVHIGEQV